MDRPLAKVRADAVRCARGGNPAEGFNGFSGVTIHHTASRRSRRIAVRAPIA
jgi:hypothetical protein